MAPRYAVGVLVLSLLGACAAVPPTGLELAQPHYEEGMAAMQQGDLSSAIRYFSEALRIHPTYPDALFRRGSARLKLVLRGDATLESQEIERAVDDLGRALSLYPLHYEAAFNRALALAALGRYRETARDLDLALGSPEVELQREAHLKLGMIYEEKFEDMQPQAIRHYEKYLELGGKASLASERVLALRNRAAELSSQTGATRDADAIFFDAVEMAGRGEKLRAVDRLEPVLSRLSQEKKSLAETMIAQWRREGEADRTAATLLGEARKLVAEGKKDLARELLRRVTADYGGTGIGQKEAPALLKELSER